MANLDELQIKIEANSKDATAAIDTLITGLNNLNQALNGLDTSKISQFANAVSKLSNIGNNTNTTAKTLKGIAKEITDSFGIKSKKGIQEVTEALQELYSAQDQQSKGNDITGDMYLNATNNVKKAIEANYSYKESVDSTIKSVRDYVNATNKAGTKIGMADMAKEFGENFKAMQKVLGSAFRNNLSADKEGVTDLATYLAEMNSVLGTQFDTEHVDKGLEQLVTTLKAAKAATLDFKEASKQGLISEADTSNAVDKAANKIWKLYEIQSQYGATSGLSGLAKFFNQMSSLDLPDFSGAASAIKEVQKASEQVSNSAPKVEQVSTAVDTIKQSSDSAAKQVEVLRDSLNGLGNSKKVIEGAAANAGNLVPQERGFISDVQATGIEKMLPAVVETQKYALMIPPAFDEICRKAYEATQQIEEMGDATKNVSEGTPVDDAKDKIDDIAKSAKKAHEQAEKPLVPDGEGALSSLIALGSVLGELSEKFGQLSNKSIGLFKFMIKPLQMATNEYTEKFRGMQETVANFQKTFKDRMTKVSQFWKRTMKTFTFMVVRKAITAIITEVNNAIQSLAMYSNSMGTAFNKDISLMVADFQYLGRSIVSVFAPLLNTVVPIIDAIVDRIAVLISYIGMLFAALGGGSTFTKAKKNVGNYAASLDKASKSAKNLTMGIDELNILSEQSGGGGAKPYDGWEDAWEDVDIPQWVKDLADWLKDLWHKFFDPIKEAWDRAKQYIIDGFKTMINSLKRMMSDIGRDFFEVWGQEKTIRMFEQLFRIIGDIERVVRNLANGFNEAWNYNKTGLHIIENIRDILATLVDHARNISYYMIGWAEKIDFKPMLQSFEALTDSAKRFADFIGGVVEDVFVYGILKYINFLIEDAIPHLQHTLAGILDAFNFVSLREKIRPLIEAIEGAFESLHTGVTNAIGNLGRELAEFTNSKEFSNFLETIARLAREITAARVEKVLTGLGKGILAIGKAVVKFVNSKVFQKFIEFIGDWIDKHSSDDIAKILEAIANSILVFKFAEFTTSKLSGVFKFFTVLTALNRLEEIVSGLTGTAKGLEAIGATSTAVGTLYNPLSRITGLLPSLQSNLTTTVGAFKNMFTVMGVGGGIKGIFEAGATAINGFAASLSPLTVLIGSVTTAFLEWKGVEKSASDLAHALNGDTEYSIGGSILGIVAKIGIASAAFTAFLGFPAGLVAGLVVGAISAIKGIQETVEQINFDRIGDAITTQGEMTLSEVKSWYGQATDIINENINKWKDAERNLTQDRGDIAEYAKEIQNFSSVFEGASGVTSSMADKLVGKYEDLKGSIDNYIDQSTDALVSNLLAQKSFLEAQGVDVDQMIVNIYRGAEEEKKAIDGAVETVKEAVKGLDGLTEGTAAYEEQMKKVVEATSQANTVLGDYTDQFSEIDTSEAVSEIEALGHSLDLSQYADDPDAALKAISSSIDEVKATYTTKMSELKSEADRLKEEAKLMPNITDEQLAAFNLSIDYSYQQAGEKLAAASNQVLGLYSQDLSTQMATVAENAAADWDKGIVSTFLQPYRNKEEYILYQMQQYNDNLVKNGVEESLKGAYAKIPNNVSADVVTSMQGVIDEQTEAFYNASMMGTGIMQNSNYDMLTSVLGAVNKLDYETPASTFATQHYNAMYQHMQGYDYQSLGSLWNTEAGNAVLSNAQLFEDSNRLTANEGAAAFSQEYRDFLAQNQETVTALEETGAVYGGSIVEGLNKKIEEDAATTQPVLDTWFSNIKTWIHDNPFMPFGSPNKQTEEYGKDMVAGLNLGIATSATTTITAVNTWFTYINAAIRNKMNEVKATFNTMLTEVFSGAGWDYNTPIVTLFTNVTTAITDNLMLLGENLLGTQLPMFMDTYILPFFNAEMWQPLFDVLLNEVFITNFTTFTTWFTTVMTEWWNNGLLIWFKVAKWDKEIFDPLKKNNQLHWNNFKKWWDTSIKEWWDKHLINPWFTNKKWDEDVFLPLKKNIDTHWKNYVNWWDTSITDWWNTHFTPWITKWLVTLNNTGTMTKKLVEDTFQAVEKSISDHIEAAKTNVVNAANEMKAALQHVADVLGEIIDKLNTLSGLGVDIHLLGFADGGFPAEGSLFFAGEQGAELIGNIGGRTAVASNDEITGIREAVYDSGNQEAALLAQLIAIGTQLLDKEPVVLGDKDIALMANNGQSQLGMRIIT